LDWLKAVNSPHSWRANWRTNNIGPVADALLNALKDDFTMDRKPANAKRPSRDAMRQH